MIVHASVLGFADQAGADALAKGLLEKPPGTSFGKCEVTAAICVANEPGEGAPPKVGWVPCRRILSLCIRVCSCVLLCITFKIDV